jgi:hypothetical protein
LKRLVSEAELRPRVDTTFEAGKKLITEHRPHLAGYAEATRDESRQLTNATGSSSQPSPRSNLRVQQETERKRDARADDEVSVAGRSHQRGPLDGLHPRPRTHLAANAQKQGVKPTKHCLRQRIGEIP